MEYEITLAKDWSYKDHKRGPQTVRAGIYRVPQDLKDAVARMAIDAGAGVRSEIGQAADPAKPRRTYTRRKTPAPENRAFGAAPENKSLLE
jgi:hypothetical protein